MRKSNRISFCFHIVCLILAFSVSSAHADIVLDAVEKVSQGQYTSYQLEIESMGLGLYGGPDYNQGYRNRDGWAGGGTLGNDETRLYLTDQFAAMGMEVETQGRYKNIVAELPGVATPENIYIVSGHFDTTSNGERPGGDDNASGTAGVLEAARVLTQYNFDSTLRFIGFNAEEDWMKGSQDYIDTVVVPNRENIMGVINLDMILRPAWDAAPEEPSDLDVITGDSDACLAWADTFIDTAAAYTPSLLFDEVAPHTDYFYASDQGPFITAGYPALLAIENTAPDVWAGSNGYYHSSEDASDGLANDPCSPSGVLYDYGFATDIVKATVATIALEAGLLTQVVPGFHQHQTIPTNTAGDLEFFAIESDHYLAIANTRDDTTYDVNSAIYKWDGTSFVEHQVIPTQGAGDWEFVTIADDHYLLLANTRDDTTHNVDSVVFRWDGDVFVEHQSIPTHGAMDWECFTVGADHYAVVANMHNDVTPNTDSSIYKWNGTNFEWFQSIATNGAQDWESFPLGQIVYLAVANMTDGITPHVDSKIYQWTGTAFAEIQSIATDGASDWESFTIQDDSFLVVANKGDDPNTSVDSEIYRWNGSEFVHFQSIPTCQAADWAAFNIHKEPYLAVANAAQTAESRVYRWNGMRFIESSSIPVFGASTCGFFASNDRSYLGFAAAGTPEGMAVALYEYDLPNAGDSDDISGGVNSID